VPGFAVERDGTLHTSLMRSCTGWPSGTWIDPPQRKAPDGSNFQLQHWSHTFDFALVTGAGDWRAVEMPSRSVEFNHPMLCVPVGEGSGGLPADGSLLDVQPAKAVHLGALKPRGNPSATGSAVDVDPAVVTLRLVETLGASTDVAITSSVGAITDVIATDLLETECRTEEALRLHGHQIGTVCARFDVKPLIDAAAEELAPEAEAAQPLYSRYWLHNRGPAPLGGLPAVAHLHPEAVTAQPGDTVRLRLTIASDCSDATVTGVVRTRNPWTEVSAVRTLKSDGDVAGIPFELPPRGYTEREITAGVPVDAKPGHYPVRTELRLSGDVPPAWRQAVEDIAIITVGETPELVRLVGEPHEVVVERGQRARLIATVGSGAAADLDLEAHLISPWGTWEWIGPAACGAVLPAGGTVDVGFDVAPPPWVEPGQWWALIRIGCAGRLLYTPAVAVTVR
ncbi:MAG: NEW3 domain-containing protein, partial [Mycobacterium sp.]